MLAQRLCVPLLAAMLVLPRIAAASEDGGAQEIDAGDLTTVTDPADPLPTKSNVRIGGGGLADNGCECRSTRARVGASPALGVALALAAALFARRKRG